MSKLVSQKVVDSYHYYDPVHAYFLVYGIKNNNFSEKIKINPNYEEFDKLNQRVINQKDLEVTAVSAVNLWRIADNYYLLRSGSTQRSDVGPIIVSKKKYKRDEIKDLRIAIPGKSFSGYFYYKLFFNAKEEVVVRFDKIINSVVNGEVDAGLLIPGPTTTALYQKYGLVKIADINEEWKNKAGDLPLPLGSYVVSKRLGYEIALEIRKIFQQSIKYALSNQEEALNYALNYAPGSDKFTVKSFIDGCKSIYDMGDLGIKAIKKVHEIAKERGLIEKIPEFELV